MQRVGRHDLAVHRFLEHERGEDRERQAREVERQQHDDSRRAPRRGDAQQERQRRRSLGAHVAHRQDSRRTVRSDSRGRAGFFWGGCTLEAAEAVCNAEEDLGVDLLDTITSLVEKSLLSQTGAEETEPRFTMLETIREYGRERLERSGELDSTRRAHSAYCLVLAEEGAANMAPAEREAWLGRCDEEHDNFRAAIEYLIESANAEWGLRLGSALFWFWEPREHLTEGRRSLMALLGIPGAKLLRGQYARAVYAAGVLADIQLDFDSHLELMNTALEMQRELGNKEGIATLESALAIGANKAGRFSEARSHIERALLLRKELGSSKFVLDLTNLANIAKRQGDFAIARTAYEATLEAFRSAGDTRGAAVALSGLGDVAAAQGALLDARRLYEDSLNKFQQIGDPWGVATVLRDLGDLARHGADYPEASRFYKEALIIFHTLGYRRGMAVVLEHLAVCATYNTRPDCALKFASAAAAMRENLGISLSPTEQQEFDQCINSACEKLPKAEQTKAWAEGRSMTADQVLEYVRSGYEPPAP